ncbi:MAG: sulfite exporter TauE/SafE family protein [Ilumatobacteraceae bacterium]|nr:sulfite exporter TauE/SafE family protein [Ilumatobacteraceae bacterium]
MTLLAAAGIGLVIGFLGGMFGKGGSAIATPLLAAVGVPAIVAVAAPLPATIPSTLAASSVYWKARLIDWRIVRWSLGFGIPATIAGAIATRWIGGAALVTITDCVLVVLGLRFLVARDTDPSDPVEPPRDSAWLLAGVATAIGLVSGLLANSGGFLLAPLYIAVLRLPVKAAFASSLAVATVLAVPGTVVHAALGHIDWTLVAVFAVTSVPLSFLGANVALRTEPKRLERVYGAVIGLLGIVFLVVR